MLTHKLGVADIASMNGTPSWYSKLDARWGARRAESMPERVGGSGLQLRRIPTLAERLIAAPRSVVWAAVCAVDETGSSSVLHIVGSPTTGVGARHVQIGPPLPPFGMHSVIYTEVTGMQEGWWMSLQTLAGIWEYTETWVLADAPGDQTLARITGWWLRPAPTEEDLTAGQNALNERANQALERLAEWVRATAEVEDGSEPG